MTPIVKSHIALLILNMMYGANYVVAKGLMPGVIGPNGFILMRVIGAGTLFWLLFLRRFQKVEKKDILRLAICGLFGVGINQLFFFNGLMLTSPVNASVIMITTPIIVFILSLILLKERAEWIKIVGLIIGAIGSIIFTMQSTDSIHANIKGDLFIMVNAASYALYLVLVKPMMAKYKPLTVITWVFTFGLIYVLIWPYSTAELSSIETSALTLDSILRFAFVVIGVTFLPYLLMVYAMKIVSAAASSTYIYLQPLLAAFFVYVFYLFGLEDYTDDFSWIKFTSAFFVFVGVYLVIRPPKKLLAKR
ncbi:MAG: DMT family transporter [Crocinitomicaceae bacterium]